MTVKSDKKEKCRLGDNLDYLLDLHNIDIKNLALAVGIPASTIARIRRKGNPTVSTLEPLLNFFRVDMDTLLYADMSQPEFQAKRQSGKFVYIPVVDFEKIHGDVKRAVTQSKITKFVGAAGITGKNTFGVNVSTQSLSPVFRINSIIIIDPDLKPKEGDYVLCSLGSDNTPVFRQIFMDGSQHFFKPVNPSFGDMKAYKQFSVVGVVIKSIESYR